MTTGVLNGAALDALAVNAPGSLPSAAGWPWQVLPFKVPRVLASAWRSPEGVPGLVLINWGRSPATWVGTWEPSEYGMSEVESYGIAIRTLAAPAAPMGGGGPGPGSGGAPAAGEDCSDTGVAPGLLDLIVGGQLAAAPSATIELQVGGYLKAIQTIDLIVGGALDQPNARIDLIVGGHLAVTQTLDLVVGGQLDAVGSHTIDLVVGGHIGAEVPLSHTGTLRIHARGSPGPIIDHNVDIGAVPAHSIVIITFPSTGPRTGSGFTNGFSSGFGGSQSIATGPTAFSNGFDQGFL